MSLRVYNLGGIADAVFARADWAPSQSTVAKARVREFISNSVVQLALEAPGLFDEDVVRIAVNTDAVPTLATDVLEFAGGTSAGDRWVLQTFLTNGASGALAWNTDGEWGARGLLLKEPDSDPETWHLYRIREVWTATTTNSAGTTAVRVLVSLDRPWVGPSADFTGIEYKVVNNEFVLPDDVIEVRSISLMENTTSYPYPLHVIGQELAEHATFPNHSESRSEGQPHSVYRRQRQAIPGPSIKPGVEIIDLNWAGPDYYGGFDYVYTYAWGRQEEWTHSPGPATMDGESATTARQEPYWESPPSPVSDAITATSSDTIYVHTPNVDHMLGFDDASTDRYRRAGIKKRIYRRRLSANAPVAVPPSALAYVHTESPDKYYFLAEVDGHVTEYVDDGSVLVDVRRPLRPVHSYQTFRLHPSPDQRYELVIRCIRRPEHLQADTDTPRVTPDAIEAVILRAMAYMYEMQGNAAMAARKLTEYERSVAYLLKRYGDLRPAGRPRHRKVARVGSRGGGFRRNLAGVVTDS